MPYRCPACQHFSEQQPPFVAHKKPRKRNCKGPTSLTALQRKREEEAQVKPSAQASAAVSQPSRICFKDIEVNVTRNTKNQKWRAHACMPIHLD
eukprot:jgi/Astpho2/3963/Aster-01138